MALTSKQESFAQSVASGMTQADAYRKAYDAENMKSESIFVNASKLMADAKISLRVAELREETAKLHLWTREDSIRALKSVISNPDKANDITLAVKELNAMHGFNAPTKQELTINPIQQGLDAFYSDIKSSS